MLHIAFVRALNTSKILNKSNGTWDDSYIFEEPLYDILSNKLSLKKF